MTQEKPFGALLDRVFDLLEFSEEERAEARDGLQRKFAYELLLALQGSLPEEDQAWIRNTMPNAPTDDPHVKTIREKIYAHYSKDELHEKSKEIFQNILKTYAGLVARDMGLSEEKRIRLKNIIAEIR